jgi:hypothetical protein
MAAAAAACVHRPPSVPPAALSPSEEPSSVTELAQAIDADAKRSDHEPDSKIRGQLAAQASHDADACLALEPQGAACLYGSGVALGLMARAHPTRAGEYLGSMLDALAKAEAADPSYQDAGPARVRALVLIRAPGWPLGPGDPAAGLAAARRAAALRPLYPPNLLALAEALTKSGDIDGAKSNYLRARDAALALSGTADREDWLHQAEQGLQHQ